MRMNVCNTGYQIHRTLTYTTRTICSLLASSIKLTEIKKEILEY